jgi:hypothetical protein
MEVLFFRSFTLYSKLFHEFMIKCKPILAHIHETLAILFSALLEPECLGPSPTIAAIRYSCEKLNSHQLVDTSHF